MVGGENGTVTLDEIVLCDDDRGSIILEMAATEFG
jgi:hypothetical protein